MKHNTCIIFDNYDTTSIYEEEKAFLEENKEEYGVSEITDSMVWDSVYFTLQSLWDDEKRNIKSFFNLPENDYFLAMGTIGRWNGTFQAGTVFDDFFDMFYDLIKDCDYWKIWDENGHFYIQCSHHDGTNTFEIKRINRKAVDFLKNWEYNYDDPRKEEEIHSIIWNSNFLSSLPHFAKTMYGVGV